MALIIDVLTYPNGPATIVTNPDECGICHRYKWRCLEYPWPNHEFEPATSALEQMPKHWQTLEQVPRHLVPEPLIPEE